MSSHNRPGDGSVEHSPDASPARHNGTQAAAQRRTAPGADGVGTPIYDELAAGFDLPHDGEGAARRADAAPVDLTRAEPRKADEASLSMRPAS